MVLGDLGDSGEPAYGRSSSAMGVRGNKHLGVHGIGHEMPDGPSGVDRAGGEGPVTEAEDDADWS